MVTVRGRAARGSVTVLFALAFFLLTLRTGARVTADDVDSSWTMVMAWAARSGVQWGKDLVFTHGPLGFLHPAAGVTPGSAWRFLAGQVLLGALGSGMAAALFAQLDRRARTLLCAYLVVFHATLWADTLWIVLFGATACAVALQLEHQTRGRMLYVLFCAFGAYAAVVSLIKLSLLPLAGATWAAILVMCLAARRLGEAATALIAFPASLLIVWWLCGQSVSNLPGFATGFLQISGGYSSAMSAGAPIPVEIGGAVVLAVLVASLVLWAWRQRRHAQGLALLACLSIALLLGWKAGFTRADAHTMTFFGVAAGISLLILAVPCRQSTRPSTPLHAAIAVLCIPLLISGAAGALRYPDLLLSAPRQFLHSAQTLLSPAAWRNQMESSWQREAQRLALPTLQERIGTAPIDMFGNQQGVLLVNGMHYQPRPAFQSYFAYSPALIARNAAFYSGSAAPQFVLVSSQTVDNHLFAAEDPSALRVLLHRYAAVGSESGFVLLQRRQREAPPDPAIPQGAAWRTAELGAWVDLPQQPGGTVLALNARPSALGSMVSALVREPPWTIELEVDDGRRLRHRLVRGAARGGFLVSPLLEGAQDVAAALDGKALPRVIRFRLVPASAHLAALCSAQFTYSHWDARLGR